MSKLILHIEIKRKLFTMQLFWQGFSIEQCSFTTLYCSKCKKLAIAEPNRQYWDSDIFILEGLSQWRHIKREVWIHASKNIDFCFRVFFFKVIFVVQIVFYVSYYKNINIVMLFAPCLKVYWDCVKNIVLRIIAENEFINKCLQSHWVKFTVLLANKITTD